MSLGYGDECLLTAFVPPSSPDPIQNIVEVLDSLTETIRSHFKVDICDLPPVAEVIR